MQILHPSSGSIQQYSQQISDPHSNRPCRCPMCGTNKPLIAHGFYSRTIVHYHFDGIIRIRRYLCLFCRRTVSLLPEFALPYLRFGLLVVAGFLKARLLDGKSLRTAAPPQMPYQRGQHWVRRFRKQSRSVAAALTALTKPTAADSFTSRALQMLESIGWIRAHRFLFSQLRLHLLGWPCSLAPDGHLRSLQRA
jgi:hypothetical protein